MTKVVVSVVHYGDPEPTLACLRSLRTLGLPVLVVANGPPGSAESLSGDPGVEVLEPGSNLGYGGGHNVAFRRALELGADYVLILNNDVEVVEAGFVERLVAAIESRPGVGIAGPLVRGPDGVIQPTDERFPSFPLAISLALRRRPAFTSSQGDREVDAVNGVAMLISRATIEATGGFDERYFMYGEEGGPLLSSTPRGLFELVQPYTNACEGRSYTCGHVTISFGAPGHFMLSTSLGTGASVI